MSDIQYQAVLQVTDDSLYEPPDFSASIFKTPPRPSGNAGPKTSFDSGFFSPLKLSDNSLSGPSTSSLNTPPLVFGAVFSAAELPFTNFPPISPLSKTDIIDEIAGVSNDASVNFDEWDTNFIDNFEENFFMMNDIDEKILEEILMSPQGKALQEKAKEQDIPLQNLAFSPFRVKKSADDSGRRLVDCQVQNILTQQKIQQNFQLTVPLKVPIKPFVPIQAKTRILRKENCPRVICPSKEKLLYARQNFQQTLAKAVEESIVKGKENENKEKEKPKTLCDKYPQLKKALSKLGSKMSLFRSPSPSVGLMDSIKPNNKRTKRKIQLFYEDEDEDTDVWNTEIPFSSKQYQSKSSNSCYSIGDSETDTDCDSGNEEKPDNYQDKVRCNTDYKVQRKSNCKIVIKKVKK